MYSSSQVFFCLINITSKQGCGWSTASLHWGYAFLLLLTVLSYFFNRAATAEILSAWAWQREEKKSAVHRFVSSASPQTETHLKSALRSCHPVAVRKSHSVPLRDSEHKAHLLSSRKFCSCRKPWGKVATVQSISSQNHHSVWNFLSGWMDVWEANLEKHTGWVLLHCQTHSQDIG